MSPSSFTWDPLHSASPSRGYFPHPTYSPTSPPTSTPPHRHTHPSIRRTFTNDHHILLSPVHGLESKWLTTIIKMMPSMLTTNMIGFPQLPHNAYATDTVLDELSRQLAAASSSRRLSRGAGSQRTGNAMRITKPGSANNSPRSTTMASRRRTMIGEGPQRPHLQPVDTNYLPTPALELQCELSCEPEKRPARPMSWHPTSQQIPQQPQLRLPQQQYHQHAQLPYTLPNYNDSELLASYQQFPPTPAAYSGYTSPASTFSPLSLPFSSVDPQQYYSPTRQTLPPQLQQLPTPAYPHSQSPAHGSASSLSSSELPSLPAPRVTTTSTGSLSWDSFATHGFDKYAAPPTPEDFVAHPAATKTAVVETSPKVARDEEAMPFESMDDSESEGEILYGMGLYDVPDRDPVLDFHRSTVFSLLGGAYPEPTGKGLKLEDAWEPPASDDEEDEDDEDEEANDEDADGDEQD